MKKFLNILKNIAKAILCVTWCLPQNLLGLIVYLVSCRGYKKYIKYPSTNKKILYFNWDSNQGSMSLGEFRFMYAYRNYELTKQDLAHEYGHTIQSYILGPLYLIVIGLPSLLWCSIFYPKSKKDYDWFYCEKWATYLGKKYLGYDKTN